MKTARNGLIRHYIRLFNKATYFGMRHGLHRFLFFRAFYGFLFPYLTPNVVVVDGHKMFLNSRDPLRLSVGRGYERHVATMVSQHVKRGDVVLDLGAHIGFFTLIFAKLLGEEGEVFAFEPDPENFRLLTQNVEANGYRNVTLIPKAVSSETGKVRLYLSKSNKGDHRIYDSHDGRRSIEVEAITLDDYFKDHNRSIDFIKMDIQGAEGAAILGMRQLLHKNRSLKMVTEYWPAGLRRFGTEPEAYLRLFLDHGFELKGSINDRERKLEAVSNTQLLDSSTQGEDDSTNLFWTRE